MNDYWKKLFANFSREDILQALKDHQVLLITGGIGTGKSTQVPQFILDDFIKQGQGSKCNMIVLQSRKITAITLAQHIAAERQEVVGDVVGYLVRRCILRFIYE